jgi:predicted AlkP superfamily phosphohydrolase/phosphomutase
MVRWQVAAVHRRPSSHVLLIGLDAAEPALLQRWMDSGHLPRLRRLVEAGAAATLSTPALQFPDLVFHAAYTGRRPANLGRYFFIQPNPRNGALELVDETVVEGEVFWQTAGRHGRRCIVLDAPKLGLRPAAGGIQLVGWGAHGANPPLGSFPDGLAGELLARYGRYPTGKCDNHGKSARAYRQLRSRVLASVEARRALLLDLMRSSAWDMFFAVFAETHCAGHQFWHFEDETHPLHPRDAAYGLRTAVRDIYAAVDRAVGDLVDAAGPLTQVIVFSSHGMRPQYHGRDLLPALLRLWGMHAPHNTPPDAARERSRVVRQPLLKAMREAVPLPLQYVVKRCLPAPLERSLLTRLVGTLRLEVEARAFYVPNHEMTPALRVNLVGRDPFGKVAPGREYDAVRDFLAQRMRELINPATGRPALEDVSLMDRLYPGAFRHVLPDLTGYWSPAAPIDALYSPGYGTVVGAHKDYRTGGHAPTGFVVMMPARGDLDGADIVDIAPSVLDLLAVPIPADVEGRSLLAH